MTSVRSPRLRVLADGAEVPGALSAEICSNNHFGADLWRARLALSAEPGGLAAWDGRTQALIELQMSLGGEWVMLVSGRIDSLSADAIAGLVTIEGRDLSAGLIETRTRESFANQTASDIASLLASRHQLAAQVTPTSTPIGRYYGANHDRVTLDRYSRASTEWDLLVWLAQQEAFDVFCVRHYAVLSTGNDTAGPCHGVARGARRGCAGECFTIAGAAPDDAGGRR
jgi:phage protein D